MCLIFYSKNLLWTPLTFGSIVLHSGFNYHNTFAEKKFRLKALDRNIHTKSYDKTLIARTRQQYGAKNGVCITCPYHLHSSSSRTAVALSSPRCFVSPIFDYYFFDSICDEYGTPRLQSSLFSGVPFLSGFKRQFLSTNSALESFVVMSAVHYTLIPLALFPPPPDISSGSNLALLGGACSLQMMLRL